MNKKYALTISILASNRKDTLPKTLNSIKPILDNVSSELIIVDTGCDEELLGIIRNYTDKIVKFQWCNDFAKARNVGIEHARGEWFMFIDDDEWFEDVTEFIHFFNSEEKDTYGFAKYIVRNYTNWEGTLWGESIAGRMFKLLDGTKFIDKVHERPVNIMGPTKNFTAYAHHYGYLYKSEEERKAHFERNMILMKEQVMEEPHIARHYAHLIQEYCTIKDYDKVMELAYEGIEKADMSYSENKKDVPALYAMVVWALVNQKKNIEAYEKFKEYIEKENCTDLCKMALHEYMAVSMQAEKKYEDIMKYADRYFEYVEYFKREPEEKYQQSAILIMESDSIENLQRVAVVAFSAASFAGDEKRLEKYMKYLDFSHRFAIPEPEQCMKNVVNIIRRTTCVAACAQIADKILKNIDFGNLLLRAVMELKGEDLQGYFKVADIMTLTSSQNGYVQYLRIVSAKDELYIDRLTNLYEKAIKSIPDLINMDKEFWEIAAVRKVDISEMVAGSSISQWMVTVDKWSKETRIRQLVETKKILDKTLKRDGIHLKYYDIVLQESLLLRKKLDGITLESLSSDLNDYSREILNFYGIIYKPDVIELHQSILPGRCQVALLLKELHADNDIQKLKADIVRIMSELTAIMNKYEELL